MSQRAFGRDLLDRHVARLREAGVPSPEVDVRWIADHVAEHGGGPDRLAALVERRATREPLQLVLGEAWFRHVRLACRPGVFIPRPETEVVAGVAIDELLSLGRPGRLVEPCTGTGAISCAVATEVPAVDLVATDRSADAVALATHNLAEALAGRAGHPPAAGASGRVVAGDLLDPVEPSWRGTVDVLVSNPPYLPASDAGTWEPEVGAHDPVGALVGGEHGNEVVDRLLTAATAWLRPGGLVVLELDPRLAEDAATEARRVGLVEVDLVRDLAGRERAVVGRRPAA